MAATDYAVRINSKEGALEVTGPDKDWVDAKLQQLTAVFSDYKGEPTGDDTGAGRTAPTARKGPKKARPAQAAAPEAATTVKKKRATSARSQVNTELRDELTAEVKQELKQYIADRRKAWDGAQSAQAAIIATFLHDRLGVPGVDQDDVYTVYTTMGERSPGNIRSQLTNARQRARYFEGLSDGKMILSHAGENFARFDALDAEDDDS
jgi:hypothetical protein